MLSIILEVKNENKGDNVFYNPSPTEFRKFPRTKNGVSKAMNNLKKVIAKYDWIEDYRFVIYCGKYEGYKKISPMFIVDSKGNTIQ